MVTVLVLSVVVDRELEADPVKPKTIKVRLFLFCFSAKYAALRRKSTH